LNLVARGRSCSGRGREPPEGPIPEVLQWRCAGVPEHLVRGTDVAHRWGLHHAREKGELATGNGAEFEADASLGLRFGRVGCGRIVSAARGSALPRRCGARVRQDRHSGHRGAGGVRCLPEDRRGCESRRAVARGCGQVHRDVRYLRGHHRCPGGVIGGPGKRQVPTLQKVAFGTGCCDRAGNAPTVTASRCVVHTWRAGGLSASATE
jgi:hypothetical protein